MQTVSPVWGLIFFWNWGGIERRVFFWRLVGRLEGANFADDNLARSQSVRKWERMFFCGKKQWALHLPCILWCEYRAGSPAHFFYGKPMISVYLSCPCSPLPKADSSMVRFMGSDHRPVSTRFSDSQTRQHGSHRKVASAFIEITALFLYF